MYPRFVVVLALLCFLGLVLAVPSPHPAIRQATSVAVPAASATTTDTVPTANIGGGSVATSSTPSPTPFVLPGTTLQVLPVGLGVYGGITAIAVFVFIYGTWHRVQCRKAFRRQRAVEHDAIVAAYGGVTKG